MRVLNFLMLDIYKEPNDTLKQQTKIRFYYSFKSIFLKGTRIFFMALLVIHGIEVLIYIIITTMENVLQQDEILMIMYLPIILWHFYQELKPQRSEN